MEESLKEHLSGKDLGKIGRYGLKMAKKMVRITYGCLVFLGLNVWLTVILLVLYITQCYLEYILHNVI